MSNFGVLLKNNLLLSIGRMRGKKKKRSFGKAVFLSCLICVLFVAIFSFYAWTAYKNLASAGLDYLSTAVNALTMLSLILGFLRATNSKKDSDSDLLLSLPIKKSTVVMSKVVTKYLYDLAIYLVIALPFLVISCINHLDYSTLTYVMLILTSFVLPLISVGITLIVDFIVSKLFNKTKFAGLLKSLFMLVMFFVIFLAYSFTTNNFYSVLINNFIFVHNFKNIVILLLASLILILLGTFLFTMSFGKNTSRYKSKNKTLKFTNSSSPYRLFLKKDFNFYFSTPSYLINTIIGPVMMIVITIIMASLNNQSSSSILNLDFRLFLTLLLCTLLSFSASTSNISAPSISLENKSFWIIKSSPVKISTYFLSKLSLHNFIVLPVVIICSTIFAVVLKLTFVQTLLLISLPALVTIFNSIFGLFLGVCLPVLDYESETKVIKQSACVFLTMLTSFVLSVLPFIIQAIFNMENLYFVLFICLIVNLVFIVISTILLFTVGIKKFRKIPC